MATFRLICLCLALAVADLVTVQAVTPTALPEEGILLNCSATHMQVTIPTALLTPEMTGSDLKFGYSNGSANCLGSLVDGNIVFTTQLTECGTVMTETGDEEEYTNSIDNIYGSGPITRFYKVNIPLTCSYNRSADIDFVEFQLTDFTIDKSLDEDGSYRFHYDLYTDGTFSTKYDTYPVIIGLNKNLYIGASVEYPNTDLELSVQYCRATPTDNYDDVIQHDFIVNGCEQDAETSMDAPTEQQVHITTKSFRFIANDYDMVYIHCSLLVCESGDLDSLCNTDCAGPTPAPGGRRRRGALMDTEPKTKRFTRGPLRIMREAENKKTIEHLPAGIDSEQEAVSTFNPWIIAIAIMGVTVMALSVMMALVLRKVNKISTGQRRDFNTE